MDQCWCFNNLPLNSIPPPLLFVRQFPELLGDDLCMSWLAVTSTRFQYNQSCSSCLAIKLISLLSKNEFPNVYCKLFLMDALFLSRGFLPKIEKKSSWRLSQLFSIFMIWSKSMAEYIYASLRTYCWVFQKHPWTTVCIYFCTYKREWVSLVYSFHEPIDILQWKEV